MPSFGIPSWPLRTTEREERPMQTILELLEIPKEIPIAGVSTDLLQVLHGPAMIVAILEISAAAVGGIGAIAFRILG